MKSLVEMMIEGLSYDGWKEIGFQVKFGERSTRRAMIDGKDTAVFTCDQVKVSCCDDDEAAAFAEAKRGLIRRLIAEGHDAKDYYYEKSAVRRGATERLVRLALSVLDCEEWECWGSGTKTLFTTTAAKIEALL